MRGFWTIDEEKCIIWRIWFFRRKFCSVGGSLSEIARRSHGWAGLGGSRAVIIALSTNIKHIFIALNLCHETLERTHQCKCNETQEGAMMWPTLTQLSRNAGKASLYPRFHYVPWWSPVVSWVGSFWGSQTICTVFRVYNAMQWTCPHSVSCFVTMQRNETQGRAFIADDRSNCHSMGGKFWGIFDADEQVRY